MIKNSINVQFQDGHIGDSKKTVSNVEGMVEGPGCTLNGEKIRKLGPNRKVERIFSRTVLLEGFNNSILKGPETLGKELFLFFDKDDCLRLHFGMNGSVSCGEGIKGKGEPTLIIQLDSCPILFFETAVQTLGAQSCRDKLEKFKNQDVCKPSFSQQKVFEVISSQDSQRMIADVLLDQKVFPGVGNIIKNEALFDSNISPDAKLKDLTGPQIQFLIRMTRDFSVLFYKCRKTGTSLHKHCRVYNRKTCLECSSQIIVCRMGNDLNRMTYFCPDCQGSKQINKRKKSNLLDWMKSPESFKNESWACLACTFENKANTTQCSICFTKHLTTTEPTGLVKGPTQNCVIDEMNLCDSETKTFSPGSTKLDVSACTAQLQPNKRQKKNQMSSSLTEPNKCAFSDVSTVFCPQHNTPCITKTVHKKGPNHLRLFYTCGMTRYKKCEFFKWADALFPSCFHKNKAVLRTVLKIGPNNGRQFYSCGQEKSCSFFKWV